MRDKLLKKTSLFIMISFLIILLVIGITYAYFSAGISNINNEKMQFLKCKRESSTKKVLFQVPLTN